MAFRTPIVLQNENAPIRIGKHGDRVKNNLPKPAKIGHQERRALRDVSNTGKPPVSVSSKGSILKDKSAIPARQTTKSVPKSTFLTDEEIMRCHEWAKEGIEKAHFTGNDLQKHHKDVEENRVSKKVQKVMSALREWSNIAYDDMLLPSKEVSKEFIDVHKMEIEEEVLPCLASGNKEFDDLSFEPELEPLAFLDCPAEFKLKEEECCTSNFA